ncbi:MAG: dienelactone hydrolase family protein [Flavitalea sp.]
MHQKNVKNAGAVLNKDSKVMIMLHGRGADEQDILSLAPLLNVKDFSLIAPVATNNTWYPFSFMAPPEKNEPWLSSAISMLHNLVLDILKEGIPSINIYFLGFSQGACLTLEYVTRYAMRYGGVVAFTGGLIGDKIYMQHYSGDFMATPVFIGCSDHDPHIPVERVYATANILKNMNASVTEKIYVNMGHTVIQNELDTVNDLMFPI